MVTAFTPGPNKIVSLYAVSQNGWIKGKNVPSIVGVLKYVGAIYILWLAVPVGICTCKENTLCNY